MPSPLVMPELGAIERPVCVRHLPLLGQRYWVTAAAAQRIADDDPCVICDACGPEACEHSRAAETNAAALRAFAREVLMEGQCKTCPPPWAR